MQDDMRMKLEEYYSALTTDFLQHANVTSNTPTDSDVIPFLLAGVAGVVKHLSHGNDDSDELSKVGVTVVLLSGHCQRLCDTSNNVS